MKLIIQIDVKRTTVYTMLELSFDIQSHFSLNGMDFSSSGAASAVEQLISDVLYMGKCYKNINKSC